MNVARASRAGTRDERKRSRAAALSRVVRRVSTWAIGAVLLGACIVAWLRDQPVPAEPLGQRAESKTAIEPMATPRAAAEAIAQNEEPSARLVPVISMPSAPPLAAPSEANVFGDRAPHDLVAGPNDENLVPGAKPHPITAEHQRLYREVGIVDAAWDALEARDFVKARLLIDEHRRRYAGENSDVDEGMSLLADCMQHPNAETRGRAQRFYDEVTYSTARRRIRRWCLATDVAELGGSSL